MKLALERCFTYWDVGDDVPANSVVKDSLEDLGTLQSRSTEVQYSFYVKIIINDLFGFRLVAKKDYTDASQISIDNHLDDSSQDCTHSYTYKIFIDRGAYEQEPILMSEWERSPW